MNFEEQMNCMTRIVLLIFIILLFANFSYDVLFLSVSILLIIIIYYSFKNKPHKNSIEYYGKVESVLETPPKIQWKSYSNDFLFTPPSGDPRRPCKTPIKSNQPFVIDLDNDNAQIIDTRSSLVYKDLEMPIEYGLSTNQSRVGSPNPRTLVKPIIPNPIYDFENWQPNDFIVPHGINDQKRQEYQQNGYVIQKDPYQKFDLPETHIPSKTVSKEFQHHQNYRLPHHEIQENYQENPQRNYNQTLYNQGSYPSVNKTCGYEPDNLRYNLPINYQANPCQKTNDMKEYNKNLFSIPIQPGLYTQSQVNQPYASMYNLGISDDQDFLPTTFQKEGTIYEYTEHDPSTVRQKPLPPYDSKNFGEPLRTEIYDPRFTGYGTSYRSYIEPMTGQPRFYYDDIDQQTQNNYISRNKLDIYGGFPKIGAVTQPILQGELLRNYANQNYTDNQLQYRTELQQRLLHKNNNREWQQRIAPITRSSRMTTGSGTMSGFYR